MARLQDHLAQRIDELFPSNWNIDRQQKAAA
jgi:hypothetical protein